MWNVAVLICLSVLSEMEASQEELQPDVADRRDGEGRALGCESRAAEDQGRGADCGDVRRRLEFA